MPPARKILIADPDTQVVRALARALRERGYAVAYAADGSKALEVAVLRHPDVILFDERCTLIEAKNFGQILTSNPRTADIPVVLTTRDPELERRREFREGTLRKPYNLDEVISRIDHLCRRVEAARELKGDAREIEGGLSQLPLADLLQILSVNRRTGRLVLSNGHLRGEIHLANGRPVNARTGEVEGDKALFRLLSWKEGQFAFAPGQAPARTKIERSMEDALLEGARQSDERERLTGNLPPLAQLFGLSEAAAEPVEPHPVTAAVLDALQKPTSLSDVLDLVDAPDLDVLSAIGALIERGVIRHAEGDIASAPILSAAEVHALRGQLLRGKLGQGALVVKVAVVGGPKAGRALLKGLPTVIGVATEPGCLRSGFGTLGRLEVSEGLKIDFLLLPLAEAARPLWRPFAHGVVGALVFDDSDPSLKQAHFLGFDVRVPLAMVAGAGSGLFDRKQLPPLLRGAPRGIALVHDDLAAAVRVLLVSNLQPPGARPTEDEMLARNQPLP